MSDIINIANAIYGEAANQPADIMKMVGSTIVNRALSGRHQEFGASFPEIIQKGYYAASNPNVPYKQALAQKFPDSKSENQYKQALQIASGLVKGTIKPDEGLFYFTDKEINKLKKNPKAFNFKKVKEVGKSGGYRVFKYY